MVLKGKLMNFRTKSTNRRKNLPADIQIIFPPRSWRGWDWGIQKNKFKHIYD